MMKGRMEGSCRTPGEDKVRWLTPRDGWRPAAGRWQATPRGSRARAVAARACRFMLLALERAEEQMGASGLLDTPLSTSPRDTWRNRFPALRQHLVRFILCRYGFPDGDRHIRE